MPLCAAGIPSLEQPRWIPRVVTGGIVREPGRARGPLDFAKARQTPQFYVIDAQLSVVFRTAPGIVGEETPLPANVTPVVRRLLQNLGAAESSGIGIVSATQIVRVLRMGSRHGHDHFAVFVERFAVRNSVQNAATRFGLSPRETQVLEGLMRGESTNEIAHRLGIGATTVQEHIRKIGRKTDVTKRSAIVATVFGLR